MGGTGMKDVGGAVLAGSSPPFRERAADLDFYQLGSVFFSFTQELLSCGLERVGVTMTAGATLRVILTTSMVYTLTTASSNGRNFTLWSDAIELTEDNVSCWRCKLHKHRPC